MAHTIRVMKLKNNMLKLIIGTMDKYCLLIFI
jgi:hypothetical protein